MSGSKRPFRDVKLQWLQQLSCDKDLSDSARSVALYVVTTHLNGHTEKAWPSYQTIADATGKSVKTIQRAVHELEVKGWFEIRRGNGIGHNTEYRPSATSILRASEAREKADNVVTLYPDKGGQNRPSRRSNVSVEGGQLCPPNPEKEKIYKSNAREGAQRRVQAPRAVPLVFVAVTMTKQINEWRAWLCRQCLPPLQNLDLWAMRSGKSGYLLPGYWPPDDGGCRASDWISFFSARSDDLAYKNMCEPHFTWGGHGLRHQVQSLATEPVMALSAAHSPKKGSVVSRTVFAGCHSV